MREPHQQAIGALIARLRRRQGWSQRALARWVDVDQSAVSRIEAGRRRLSADELQRFADALHVSADELLKGLPGPPVSAARSTAHASRSAGEYPFRTAIDGSLRADAAPSSLNLASSAETLAEPSAVDVPGGPDAEPPAAARAPAYAERTRSLEYADAESAVPSEYLDAVRPALPLAAPPFAAPHLAGLPAEAAGVARDWFALRELAAAPEPVQRWSIGHSAEGKPARVPRVARPQVGIPPSDVLFDRVARFWRSELHVAPHDGPLPDLVPLLEDGYGAQVVVARVGGGTAGPASDAGGSPATDRPVAAVFTHAGVPFIFVNAARPVVLQRFALAHAFAHLVLGHGDVVDDHIEWNRNMPPEAAANDFAEELLAPVRAVQRWYERRPPRRWPSLEDLLDLGNAFGISAWAALYRSRAADKLQGKQFHALKAELRRHEWEVLPRQAYLGGLRDTLTHLTPGEALPALEYGGPAVLRVPAAMRAWALAAVVDNRLSLEGAAARLHLGARELERQLALLGVE